MNRTQANPIIEEYVARCSVLLWDLSPALQDQLREDIRQIVGEVAMELDGRPDDLVGPPLRFVSELRTAAGLPEIPAAERLHPEPPPPEAIGVVVTAALLHLLRAVRVAAWPWTKQLGSELRPAWWVARGFGLAFILGAITGWDPQGFVPNLFNSQLLGVVSTAGFVISSVQLGRRGPGTRLRQFAWAAASVAALISLVSFAGQARYPNEYGYEPGLDYVFDEPYVEYQEDVFFAEPAGLGDPEPLVPTTIAFAKSDPDLVYFVDPLSGSVLQTAGSEDAIVTAIDLAAGPGTSEVVIEFQGHQHRVQRSDLVPLVQSLFNG